MKKIILLLVVFVSTLGISVLKGQTARLDSLYELTQEPGIRDTLKVNRLNAFSRELCRKDPKRAGDFSREAFLISKHINYSRGLADASYVIGISLFYQGVYEEAMQWFDVSMVLFSKMADFKGISSVYRNKGSVYSIQGNDTLALDFFIKALTISKRLGDMDGIAQAYNNLGILYDKQKNDQKAIEYYYLTLNTLKQINAPDKVGLAYVMNNIGINYSRQRMFEEAIPLFQDALVIAESSQNKQLLSTILGNMGLAYYNSGRITRALEILLRSIKLKEELNDLRGLAITLNSLGSIYRELGLHSQAFVHYERSLQLARQLGMKNLVVENSREVSRAYAQTGDFEKAFKAQTVLLASLDSVMKDENQKRISELQAQFEFEIKEQEIEMLTRLKEAQQKQLTINRMLLYLVLLALVIIAILLGVIFNAYKQKTRMNELLEGLNQSLETKVAEEVTKNRQKDVMLIQKNRQAAMGEMVSSIAHQWRQPLNALGVILQNIETSYYARDISDEYMAAKTSKAMELIGYMSDTIDDFRDFFKPGKQKLIFNVKEVVEKSLAFINPGLSGTNVKINLKMQDDIKVFGYANEFAQAVINILNNAREILLERSCVNPEIQVELFSSNGNAELLIRDNAGGIPEEIMDKIFDPYFTTRNPNIGTGLGLYIAQTIIEKHMEGEIHAQNTLNGAQFRITVKSIA